MPLVFPTPQISTSFAHGLAVLFSFCYVGSIYVSKNSRLSFSSTHRPPAAGTPREKTLGERWRDDPDVIRARLVAVTIATTLCCAGVFTLLWHLIGGTKDRIAPALEMTISRLGFKTYLDLDSLYPHLVTPILFLGPLHAKYLSGYLPFQRNWDFKNDVVIRFFSWQGIRNYILAPITEEIVFRACVISVYHLSGASTKRMIFLGPLSFGLAHVHHAWDTFNRYGRTSDAAKRAIIMTLFQFGYTTLFGFHCSFLFLRTNSILPPITSHIFCNFMGLPDVVWELRKFPNRRGAILSAYVLGIAGFVWTLGPWTHTNGGLYWRNKGSY